MEGKAIYAALLAIQQDLKVPKDQKGCGYDYRTADGILQAVKPLLRANGVACLISDKSEQVGARYYIVATVKLIDIATGDYVESTGVAVEPDKLASMAPPQITGTASTYARKRALEGLFLLDNEKDIDSRELQDKQRQTRQAPKPQGAPNVQQGAAAGNNDELYKKALFSLTDAIKAAGVTSAEAIAVAEAKYGKSSTKQMTLGEISDLAAHLGDYLMEMGA